MRKILIASIFFFMQSSSWAAGPIPFLFMPLPKVVVAPPPPDLAWIPATFQFDGTFAYTTTVTLQNNTAGLVGPLTVNLTAGNGSITIAVDNCSGNILLAGGACTMDIYFNGTFPSPLTFLLHGTDGTVTATDLRFTNCPGC